MKKLALLAMMFCLLTGYSFAESPYDLKQFITVTYDTAYYPTLADVDSVQGFFVFNGNEIYDTTLTTSLMTGYYLRETNVCNWYDTDSLGAWGYVTRAWCCGATITGGKSWSYTVKIDPLERDRNAKILFVKPDADAVIGGTGCTWIDACSLSTVQARATGASEYTIYVAPGIYSDVEIDWTVSAPTKIFGAGINSSILIGKKDVSSGLGSHYVFRMNSADTSAVEFAGFTVQSFRASTGDYDSVTHWGVYPLISRGWYMHDCLIRGFYYGIQTCGASIYGRFEDNRILHSVSMPMKIEGGSGNLFRDNAIDSVTGSAAVGINVSSTSYDNIFTSNIVAMNKGRAIYCASGTKRNIFANNSLSATGDSVIVDAGDNVFIGNHRRSQSADPQTLEDDLAVLEGYVDGIETKTNNLPADPASETNVNANETKIDVIDGIVDGIAAFLGATDGDYFIFYPLGSANKDSLRAFNSADACVGTMYFLHTGSVIDSTRWEKW